MSPRRRTPGDTLDLSNRKYRVDREYGLGLGEGTGLYKLDFGGGICLYLEYLEHRTNKVLKYRLLYTYLSR